MGKADFISESLEGILKSFIKTAMISETVQQRTQSLRTQKLIVESLRKDNKPPHDL